MAVRESNLLFSYSNIFNQKLPNRLGSFNNIEFEKRIFKYVSPNIDLTLSATEAGEVAHAHPLTSESIRTMKLNDK